MSKIKNKIKIENFLRLYTEANELSIGFYFHIFCLFLLVHPQADGEFIVRRGWGKTKLKPTTLPSIFIHVVCRFNSIAYSHKNQMHIRNPALAGVSVSCRGSDSASCPYRPSPSLLKQRQFLGWVRFTAPKCPQYLVQGNMSPKGVSSNEGVKR